MSVLAFSALLGVVGLLRLVELAISKRNQRRLEAKGAKKMSEPHFRWMVVLHGGFLIAAALEVQLLNRPFLPGLALPMGIVFALATALRWWVIATLGENWNVQVMAATPLRVVTDGPFRWIRHPNYLAVFVEMVALPLIYSAWLTALIGGLANVWILRRRLATEEEVLMGDAAYRETMGLKPRFLPKVF